MLSWVREKLAEGRLRWQQSVVQQSQRNSAPSPPPLPPPSSIESPPTTPDTGQHSFSRIASDDSLSTLHSPTAAAAAAAAAAPNIIQRTSNCVNQSHQQLHGQDSQIDTIKRATSSNLKRYSQISRISQRYDHGFYPTQYEPVWPSTPNANFHPVASISVNRRPNDPIQPYVNLRIFNCIGSKCTIYAPVSLTFADVKRKVLAEFHARRQLFAPAQHHQAKNCMSTTATGNSESRERIDEQQQKLSCDIDLVQLSRHYKLARISRLHEHFDEQCSLAAANVQNYEEMLLVLCTSTAAAYSIAHTKDVSAGSNASTTPTNSISNEVQSSSPPPLSPAAAAVAAVATPSSLTGSPNTNGHKYNFDFSSDSDSDTDEITTTTTSNTLMVPTQRDIDLATECEVAKIAREPNVVNIDELVLQSDVQYDIRKILISLANLCAYVIGSGPFAARIISMLKQRLVQRKQHEQDTQQCLIEMGFSRPKVQHALNINNNAYAAALEWLIENQSPTNPLFSEEQSSSMSLSSKFTNNTTVKDNIESLLEIIRIYCQRDLPPPPEMVQFIVGMGFDEATAREALKITRNHQTNACEWLVGDRSKINPIEQKFDGLPSDSPILVALLNSPHIQLSLSNPKIFIAYLSILEDYGSMSMWLNDSETSSIIGQVLRTYHEEKHIMAINQFSKRS